MNDWLILSLIISLASLLIAVLSIYKIANNPKDKIGNYNVSPSPFEKGDELASVLLEMTILFEELEKYRATLNSIQEIEKMPRSEDETLEQLNKVNNKISNHVAQLHRSFMLTKFRFTPTQSSENTTEHPALFNANKFLARSLDCRTNTEFDQSIKAIYESLKEVKYEIHYQTLIQAYQNVDWAQFCVEKIKIDPSWKPI